jgi:hypothetical protein
MKNKNIFRLTVQSIGDTSGDKMVATTYYKPLMAIQHLTAADFKRFQVQSCEVEKNSYKMQRQMKI